MLSGCTRCSYCRRQCTCVLPRQAPGANLCSYIRSCIYKPLCKHDPLTENTVYLSKILIKQKKKKKRGKNSFQSGLFVSRDPGGGKVGACASQVLAELWDRARRDSLEGSSWPRSRWASVPQQLLDLSELRDLCREACPRAPCMDVFGAAGPQSQGVPFSCRALPHGEGCRMCCHTMCGISCCMRARGDVGTQLML